MSATAFPPTLADLSEHRTALTGRRVLHRVVQQRGDRLVLTLDGRLLADGVVRDLLD